MTDDEDDYKIGWKRPPKHSRFKPGQSGNPSGRPRVKTFNEEVLEALDGKVFVTENGQRRAITRRQAGAIQLANGYASGNPKATRIVLDIARAEEARRRQEGPAEEPALSAEDRLVLQTLLGQLRQTPDHGDDDGEA